MKTTWRERELEKEKKRREEEARRAEEAKLAGLRKTEDNFPSLGGVRVTQKPMTNSGLFAKMAKEWKEKEDLDAAMERQRKEDEDRERMRSTMYTFRASRWDRTEEDDYEEEQPKTQVQPDGWTCVNTKKVRPIRERRDSEDSDKKPEDIPVQNEELAENY